MSAIIFKALPNNLKVAIDSAGGAAAGVLAGIGTLGVSAFLAAPGALGMGIVLCVKGISANKKANSNLQNAKAFRKQANDVLLL